MKKRWTLLPVLFLFLPSNSLAEKIQGHACYTYGDSESLIQAEQMAKTLAIRNAIESNSVFIESTTQITNFQLTQDLIRSFSTGQVKEVKVLKRLESGRTLCFTIEGFVDPQEIRTSIKEYLTRNSSDVRLQDNGWIRIVDHFVWEQTPAEFSQVAPDDPLLEFEKGKSYKWLSVKFQFLKPCIATTRMSEIRKDSEERLKQGGPLSPEGQALFALALINSYHKEIKAEEEKKINMWEEFKKLCSDTGIDYVQFVQDVNIPKFRCDYRIKVFATFSSSSGIEVETQGQIPYAAVINTNSDARKTEMLPGETAYVTFLIPENAKSWSIWVPK